MSSENGVDESLLIQAAVQCARPSNHPVSQAIVRSFSIEDLSDLDDGVVMEFEVGYPSGSGA